MLEGFLDAETCEAVKELARPRLSKSKVSAGLFQHAQAHSYCGCLVYSHAVQAHCLHISTCLFFDMQAKTKCIQSLGPTTAVRAQILCHSGLLHVSTWLHDASTPACQHTILCSPARNSAEAKQALLPVRQ